MSKIILKEDPQKIETVLQYYTLTNKLKDIVRDLWNNCNTNNNRLESVAEHIYGTCMLAVGIWSETLPEVNLSQVLLMLAFSEIKQCDNPKIIFEKLVAKEAYSNLLKEYDDGLTKEAVFAHKCSYLETVIQSATYLSPTQQLDFINNYKQYFEEEDIFNKIYNSIIFNLLNNKDNNND